MDYSLKAIDLLLERNGIKEGDITWLFLIQGTDIVVKDILKELKKKKYLMNYPKMGNVSLFPFQLFWQSITTMER